MTEFFQFMWIFTVEIGLELWIHNSEKKEVLRNKPQVTSQVK